MALDSFSQFWMLEPVKDDNFYLPFDEGAGELTAEVQVGEYTLTNITEVVAAALNAVGNNSYTVSFDRDTRKYTITSDGNFSLLITSGSQIGVDIFALLGFSGADTPFALSHVSDSAAGTVFSPQFRLQDYTPFDNWQEASSASISTNTIGGVEVVSFGTVYFMELNIMFSTNIAQPQIGPIVNNPTGLDDLRSFMVFATKKYPIEYIPDSGDINTFENVLLESAPGDSKGVGFKLKEMTNKSLPGYYETGKLKFRRIST